jgi:O6-methylguanine-DNA--protein-cysteine methyltransferase
MNKKLRLGLSCAIVCISANFMSAQTSIQVKNIQDFARNEVVAVHVSQLKAYLRKNKEADLRIKDAQNNYIAIQWIDNDVDGQDDELLFQAKVEAKKTAFYTIVADAKTPIPVSHVTTYSRLVPERADDYT